MSRRAGYVVLGIAAVLLAASAWLLVPPWLHPDLDPATLAAIPDPVGRVQVQQTQAALRDGVRSAVLQSIAGILVIVGAVTAWQQVRIGREGHVTGQLAHAIDQLGSGNRDVQVGGIYTLERIARNSPQDRLSIMFLLAVFVRRRVPWAAPDGDPPAIDLTLPWLRVRQPEVQAAMHVLSRRLVHPTAARLYLARTDLRGVQINAGGRLANANFNHANLARAWLQGVLLDHCGFKRADLRKANLRHASLIEVDLRWANLAEADLRDADLRRANLQGANLTGALTDGARWDGAHLGEYRPRA